MNTFHFSVVRGASLPFFLLMLFCGRAFAQNTPTIVWSTNGHASYSTITDLAFSGDGSLLVSGSDDQTAKLWSIPARTLVRTFSIGNNDVGQLSSVSISSDGTLIGAGDGDGKSRVWRASDGQRLWISGPNNEAVYSVSFSRSNDVFGIGRSSQISVSDGRTGGGLPFQNPAGPDGNPRGVFNVRFSPNGTRLASGNVDNTASLFRMPEGTLIQDLVGHSKPVRSVDFSPDGTLLVTSAGDGTARLWNTTNADARVIVGGGGPHSSVPFSGLGVGRARFSTDGKSLLTSSNGTMRFWRVSDGKLMITYTNVGNGVFAVSPDGKHFAYGTGTGSFSDTNTTVFLARMPLLITGASVRTNAFQLEWQGGTGLYHVEQRANSLAGPWERVAGPMTNTNLSVPATNRSTFFRVQNVEPMP